MDKFAGSSNPDNPKRGESPEMDRSTSYLQVTSSPPALAAAVTTVEAETNPRGSIAIGYEDAPTLAEFDTHHDGKLHHSDLARIADKLEHEHNSLMFFKRATVFLSALVVVVALALGGTTYAVVEDAIREPTTEPKDVAFGNGTTDGFGQELQARNGAQVTVAESGQEVMLSMLRNLIEHDPLKVIKAMPEMLVLNDPIALPSGKYTAYRIEKASVDSAHVLTFITSTGERIVVWDAIHGTVFRTDADYQAWSADPDLTVDRDLFGWFEEPTAEVPKRGDTSNSTYDENGTMIDAENGAMLDNSTDDGDDNDSNYINVTTTANFTQDFLPFDDKWYTSHNPNDVIIRRPPRLVEAGRWHFCAACVPVELKSFLHSAQVEAAYAAFLDETANKSCVTVNHNIGFDFGVRANIAARMEDTGNARMTYTPQVCYAHQSDAESNTSDPNVDGGNDGENRTRRLVGGVDARPGQFGSHVDIIFCASGTKTVPGGPCDSCGGTLISQNVVMTNAACVGTDIVETDLAPGQEPGPHPYFSCSLNFYSDSDPSVLDYSKLTTCEYLAHGSGAGSTAGEHLYNGKDASNMGLDWFHLRGIGFLRLTDPVFELREYDMTLSSGCKTDTDPPVDPSWIADVDLGMRTGVGRADIDFFWEVLNPPEAARSYSSVWANDTVGTGHARSMLDSPQAWSARGGSQPGGEWMQIDLGIVKQVVGVAIQARGQFFDEGQQLVTGFTVQLSTDGISFWQSEVFTVDRDSLTDGWLSEMVIDDARWVKFPRERAARYVRIVVQNWEHHVSMRAGVLTPTNQALSVADGSSGACWIDSRGCATNGANADNTYNDNEACTIKVNARGWGTVTATRFSTENGYDKLIHQGGLGQTVYEGEYSGPYNTLDRDPVMHDHQYTWRSDGSISTGIYSGWTICYNMKAQFTQAYAVGSGYRSPLTAYESHPLPAAKLTYFLSDPNAFGQMRLPVPHAIWEPYDNVPFYNEPTEWHERRTDSDLLCAERCAAVPLCAGWTRYHDGACHLAAAGFKLVRISNNPAVSGLAPTEPNTPAEIHMRVQPDVFWVIDQDRTIQHTVLRDWGSGLYAKDYNERSLEGSQLSRKVIGVASLTYDGSMTLNQAGNFYGYNSLETNTTDSYFLRTIDHAKSIESVLRDDAISCPATSICTCVPCGGALFLVPSVSCSASSEYSDNYRCEYAFDAQPEPGTDWATKGEGAGSWIQTNFAATYSISRFTYRHRNTGGVEDNRIITLSFSEGPPMTFGLNREIDDVQWFIFDEPRRTSFVKVTVDSVYTHFNNGARLIHFYGTFGTGSCGAADPNACSATYNTGSGCFTDDCGTGSCNCATNTCVASQARPHARKCHPASSTVQLQDGRVRRMDELRVGDRVKTASGFEPAIGFTHQDASVVGDYLVLTTRSTMVRISPAHYLFVNGVETDPVAVNVGDLLSTTHGPEPVLRIGRSTEHGAYHLLTPSGTYFVDDVLSTSYIAEVPRPVWSLLEKYAHLRYLLGVPVAPESADDGTVALDALYHVYHGLVPASAEPLLLPVLVLSGLAIELSNLLVLSGLGKSALAAVALAGAVGVKRVHA